ncbi:MULTISPECIES: ABC transporter ATP-binding protein [unclassified Wenzhouxiangella]|uniref:ABC transporter ATP-binding protein n=1 Tax=unclassified Wenzhouxiangella TaxID=2613841 RepID=UPI000E32C795|nr:MULTISPECIES: ABC transporter ATP-binding protein [unclassified Wenzhouxiangella]RFF28273.1 ABC transporter ATP-binding protein [Wenzhouxiangella sp. 15181]RFP69369.1 ABC transporter ATP-binding protein [Wenzhouxiangella sp. 15190]
MTESSTIAISLKDVTIRLGGRTILEDFNLEIPAGRVTAVMGPSGAGKTTVLRLATGQLRPDHGEVWIGDTRVDRLDGKSLGRLRRDIGVLLQNGALFTDLTSFDNVALPLREHTKLSESLIRRLVLMKLEMVGLRGAADLYPAELSGGMKRRIATARAMALDPKIVFYDEPFAGLDPISLGVSLRLIRDINGALGTTSVVITHDVREVARLADHACIIADRRIIATGTPDELAASEDPLVRQFMQGEPDGPVPFHYPARDLDEELLLQEADS